MYIGKVAQLSGASHKAIRHYEQLGLIDAVQRQGRYRVYTDHHVTIIRIIKRAQRLGFKLSEIAPLVAAKQKDNRFPIEIAFELIEAKRNTMAAQIAHAQQVDQELVQLKQELQREFSP